MHYIYRKTKHFSKHHLFPSPYIMCIPPLNISDVIIYTQALSNDLQAWPLLPTIRAEKRLLMRHTYPHTRAAHIKKSKASAAFLPGLNERITASSVSI